MCRHLAYLGPPLPLSRLLYDPAHALVRQSWAPVDMRGGGTINADGFGVGWFPATAGHPRPGDAGAGGEAVAVRYRRGCPMWADAELPGLAAVTWSGSVLAAVRSATDGMPAGPAATAPFGDGRWLFSHNGTIAGWPDSVTGIAGRLPVRDLLTLAAPTDSALLWALVRARLLAGAGAAEALAQTVVEVAEAARGSRLNLLLVGDGEAVATTWGHALSQRADAGTVLVASEPLDADPGWRPVPDRHLLVATAGAVRTTPLPARAARQPAGPLPPSTREAS